MGDAWTTQYVVFVRTAGRVSVSKYVNFKNPRVDSRKHTFKTSWGFFFLQRGEQNMGFSLGITSGNPSGDWYAAAAD